MESMLWETGGHLISVWIMYPKRSAHPTLKLFSVQKVFGTCTRELDGQIKHVTLTLETGGHIRLLKHFDLGLGKVNILK